LAIFSRSGDLETFVGIGVNAALLFMLLAKSRGLYRPTTLLKAQRLRIFAAWMAVLLALVSLLFLLKLGDSYSRGAALGFGVLGLCLLLGWRTLIAKMLANAIASGRILGQRAIVVGEPHELAHYSINQLKQTYGILEVGRFELSPAPDAELLSVSSHEAVLSAAVHAARVSQAEIVLLALSWSADPARYGFVRQHLRSLPLPAMLLPDRTARTILAQPMVPIGSDYAVELQRAPLTATELALKRTLDVLVAGSLLAILSPLLALVSIAIKLDSPGPVIFRQHRKGFNGREFIIYKFRTMKVAENGTIVRQAQQKDVRVTRLGSLLRSTSIDELPQLINVLRGDMSLVGPRPHALAHDDEYSKVIAKYAFRHHMKPGITGLAQVKGFRGETAKLELMERRVDLDLWYISNWSFWLDLWILIRTCIVVPLGRNAY
jgi:undecaprenyl-phosphate galactose phosphotransferase/putative colanic acid biosynthesis UDP-glucose lipid carrier transferase